MYDLSNNAHVQRIIESLLHPSQDEYRKEIDKQWRVLRGDLRDSVSKEIQKLYPKTHKNFIISEMNFAAKITDKRAKAYKQSPIRSLEREQESELYKQQLQDMQALWHWRLFDSYKNYFKYSCLWFSYYTVDDVQYPILRALRPSQFTRIVNDYGQTELFAVYFGSDIEAEAHVRGDNIALLQQDEPEDDSHFYIGLWTPTQHKVIKIEQSDKSLRFHDIPLMGNEDGVNDLGLIPAVFCQEGDERERPAFNPLKDQTITLNSLYSIIISGVSVQTFGQLVLKHPQDQEVPDISQQGIFVYLPLPQAGEGEPETNAEYITPSPNIDDSLAVFREYATAVLKEHGISGEMSGDNHKFTSGLDRLLSQMDTTEIIEENQELYALAEKQLFSIIKAFNEITGRPRFLSESLNVIYKKPKPLQSEKELLELIEKKLDLGLIEKYEALLILDPNMSPEAAKAKLQNIEPDNVLRLPNANIEEKDDSQGEA